MAIQFIELAKKKRFEFPSSDIVLPQLLLAAAFNHTEYTSMQGAHVHENLAELLSQLSYCVYCFVRDVS